MFHHKLSLFILCLMTVICANGAQKHFNPNVPIQIQSDTASFEQLAHQATYQGNIIMTQGDNILHADKLTMKKDAKGDLTVLKATGNPATFTGHTESSPHPVMATAKTIYYYPDKQLIVLEGQATLDHQQDKFSGPMLSYQLDKQVVSASRQNNERPTITIQPRVSKL